MTKQEKQNTINEAVNKGFIVIQEQGYDNYEAAQEFLNLTPRQREELNAMARVI